MNNLSHGMTVLLVALSAASITAAAAQDAPKGVNAFKACYQSADLKPGAPELKIEVVVVSQPEKKAAGMGTVKWPSVGPSFTPIVVPIEGPWYDMCTMKSCSIRFDFSSAVGAKGLKGILVVDHWGRSGIFKYEFAGGSGEVEQKASVCP